MASSIRASPCPPPALVALPLQPQHLPLGGRLRDGHVDGAAIRKGDPFASALDGFLHGDLQCGAQVLAALGRAAAHAAKGVAAAERTAATPRSAAAEHLREDIAEIDVLLAAEAARRMGPAALAEG